MALRNYEGLFIVKSDLEKEELSSLYEKIKENVKKYNGEVESTEEWGKKPLSYKIGKHKDGTFCLMKLKIDPAQVAHLSTDLKLNESIIRAMFTQKEQA